MASLDVYKRQRLLKVKNSKFLRMILVTACGFLGGMVIYLADWGNIVPTFVFFIAAIMICCEGSVIKRLTVGLMTASTVFSFNALVDNWSPFYQTYQIVIKIFFCAGLWLLIRKLGPDRDFELAPSMWRLLFILTLPPLGIVFSLVLLSDYDTAGISVQYLFLLLLSLSAFAGEKNLVSLIRYFCLAKIYLDRKKLEVYETLVDISLREV